MLEIRFVSLKPRLERFLGRSGDETCMLQRGLLLRTIWSADSGVSLSAPDLCSDFPMRSTSKYTRRAAVTSLILMPSSLTHGFTRQISSWSVPNLVISVVLYQTNNTNNSSRQKTRT